MARYRVQREVEQYVARTPSSRRLHQEAVNYLPGGTSRAAHYFDPHPVYAERGEGHYVYDVDGNKYLDFGNNATSLILGHAHPDVVEAMQRAVAAGYSFSNPVESQTRLARLLCERIPSMDSVRFTNSGTEATLNAIRAARAFTRKHKIAKFEGTYQGAHEYATISHRVPVGRLNPDGPTVVHDYPGQPPSLLEDVIVLRYNNLEESERILRENCDDLSCVIMEPVASVLGHIPARPEFLKGMRDLTRKMGIILIFDEVQSARVSPGGAQELLEVVPDMTALGKTVGGGTPAGAFGGRGDLMALFDPRGEGPVVLHAGTFNANPVTMAAGEATLSRLTSPVYEQLAQVGESLRGKLRAVLDEFEIPNQVTGIASLFGLHFTANEIIDHRSTLDVDGELQRGLTVGLMNEGVLPGSSVNVLTGDAEVDRLVDATRSVIQRLRS